MLKTKFVRQFNQCLSDGLKEKQIHHLIKQELMFSPYRKFKRISNRGLTRLYKSRLYANPDIKDNFISGLFLKDELMGLAKIEALDWYTRILKIRSAKIALFWFSNRGHIIDKDLLIRDVISYAQKKEIGYLSIHINAIEQEKVDLLLRYKFIINGKTLNLYFDRLKNFNMPELAYGIKISNFSQRDIPQIRQIAYRIYSNALLKERKFKHERIRNFYSYWAQQCCRGRSDAVLVIKKSGKIMGFIACNIKNKEEEFLDRKIGFIDLIIIDKEYQGQRFGSLLLSAGIDWFSKKNVLFIELGVSCNNYPAIGLYKKMGFKALSSTLSLSRFLN